MAIAGVVAHDSVLNLEIGTHETIDAMLIPERLAPRERLVSQLRALLNIKGVLILKGSTGMGKSTLAGLIANQEETSWRNLKFRGFGPEEIRNRLVLAALADSRQSAQFDYILINDN
jgi:MoxR-like ATPase